MMETSHCRIVVLQEVASNKASPRKSWCLVSREGKAPSSGSYDPLRKLWEESQLVQGVSDCMTEMSSYELSFYEFV